MSHDDEAQLLPQLDPFLRAGIKSREIYEAPAAVILTVSTGAPHARDSYSAITKRGPSTGPRRSRTTVWPESCFLTSDA